MRSLGSARWHSQKWTAAELTALQHFDWCKKVVMTTDMLKYKLTAEMLMKYKHLLSFWTVDEFQWEFSRNVKVYQDTTKLG